MNITSHGFHRIGGCPCSTSRTDDQCTFVAKIVTRHSKCSHDPCTIGVVSFQFTIIVNDGVHCTDLDRFFRTLIEHRHDLCLVWDGDVQSPYLILDHDLSDSIRCLRIECKWYRVKFRLLYGSVLYRCEFVVLYVASGDPDDRAIVAQIIQYICFQLTLCRRCSDITECELVAEDVASQPRYGTHISHADQHMSLANDLRCLIQFTEILERSHSECALSNILYLREHVDDVTHIRRSLEIMIRSYAPETMHDICTVIDITIESSRYERCISPA